MSRDIVKIRRVAQSLVVTLPQHVLAETELNEGDYILIEADPPTRIVLKKEEAYMPSALRLELEVEVLERKKAAIESQMEYIAAQLSMPTERDGNDGSVTLNLRRLGVERDQIALDLAQKHLQVFEAQRGQPTETQTGTTVTVEVGSIPTADDFRRQLRAVLQVAEKSGKDFIDLNAGEFHRKLGSYPGRNQRMPTCCDVMWQMMVEGDRVLQSPKKRRGPKLTIRYCLPRPKPVRR